MAVTVWSDGTNIGGAVSPLGPALAIGSGVNCRRRRACPSLCTRATTVSSRSSPKDSVPVRTTTIRSMDGRKRPDPVSRWQPQGVHGPSRVVDPAAFAWSDRELARHTAGRLHHLRITHWHVYAAGYLRRRRCAPEGSARSGRNGGRNHAGRRVSRRAQLGDTTAWGCMPRNRHMGGPDGLKRLVNACHQMGPRRRPRRRLQPRRPRGQLPGGIRAVLHQRLSHSMGGRHQLRWPGQRRACGASSWRTLSTGSPNTMSTPCAWMPSTASSTSARGIFCANWPTRFMRRRKSSAAPPS